MAVERIIGVDFGTSTSVIRVKRYENGNPIGEKLETKEVIFGGSGAMVPTLIMKKNDDASVCYFGDEAKNAGKKYTQFHGFKMDLESSDPAKRAQARLLTEEFYAYLAKQYKSQSEGGHLGNPDDKERTIISYPVKWNEETKNFMLETAKKAGFPNVTGRDEAQAAIQAVIVMSTDHLQKHGLLKNGEGANILLIDMGAGTTDLVLARYVPGDEPKTEVLNTWPKSGDVQFGGREIDGLLQNFFRDLLDEDDAAMVFRRIGSDKFKSWKEWTVSPKLLKNDSVGEFEALDSCVEIMEIDLADYCLDRAAFENCLADYLKQFPELINGCLQNIGMSGSDVDLVIVTGGHSQWYFVNDMLSGKMPQFGDLDLPKIRENPARIIPISRPQETVALGLAYSGIHFDLSDSTADDGQDRKTVMDDLSRTLNAVKEQKQEQSHESIAEDFRMKFDPTNKAFTLSGMGTVVIGTVLQGCVEVGERVYVCGGPGQSKSALVKNIALHRERKNVNEAHKGDEIAVLLAGISVDDANRGTYIASEPDDYIQIPDEPTQPLQGDQTVHPDEMFDTILSQFDDKTKPAGDQVKTLNTIINANTYTIPNGKSITGAVKVLKDFFVSKNMETQYLQNGNCHVIQARTPANILKKVTGGDKSVEVRLTVSGGNQVKIEVGGGKWVVKSAGAVISTFLSGPLMPIALATYGTNVAMQAKIIADAQNVAIRYFSE